MNGKEVRSNESLRNTISLMAPGTKIKLMIFRDGKEKEVTVEVGSLSKSKFGMEISDTGKKLGLGVVPINSEIARQLNIKGDRGVIVAEVTSGSPAEDVGIEPGMIILSVNQIPVNTVAEFNKALEESAKTKKAVLLVKTGRFSQYVVLRLD
jgi:S1-C subfamily serine protease